MVLDNISLFNNTYCLDSEIELNTVYTPQKIKGFVYTSSHFNTTFVLFDIANKKVIINNHDPQLQHLFGDIPQGEAVEEEDILSLLPVYCQQFITDCIAVANEYMFAHCKLEDNIYYFSLNMPLITDTGMTEMVSIKFFPCAYTSFTPERIPLYIYYQVAKSDAQIAGGLSLHFPTKGQKELILICRNQDQMVSSLSFKEYEITLFELAAMGHSEKEIADKMNIRPGTLKHIKSSIMLNMNAASTAQVIAMLTRQGLL